MRSRDQAHFVLSLHKPEVVSPPEGENKVSVPISKTILTVKIHKKIIINFKKDQFLKNKIFTPLIIFFSILLARGISDSFDGTMYRVTCEIVEDCDIF